MKKFLLLSSLLGVLVVSGCSKGERYAGEWRDLCKANTTLLEGAKQQWALENKKKNNDRPVPSDLDGFLRHPMSTMKCAAGGVYSLNTVGEPVSCSIPSHNH